MSGTDEQQLIRDLRHPAAWPDAEDEIGFVETHISRVFLGRDRVLKLKRPVNYSFVDYSTLAKREQACHDEVRLNRLLSNDIYLGVVPVVRDGDRYRIGSAEDAERAVEWGTWMRRINDRQMLDGILQRGELPDRLADRLAERLLPFHQRRQPLGQDAPDAVLDEMVAVLTENLDEVAAFDGNPLPTHELGTIDRVIRAYLDDHRHLLRDRVVDGWVREGHGDLRCEHVIVPPAGPVQVFDCVEFNVDLRMADVASDLSFLLMDLVRLGAPDGEVRHLIERYREADVDLPVGLLRLYWMHRALVRAKVHCLSLADLKGDARQTVARKAVDYVHIAYRQAVTIRPALIAMTGLSGTGKSTVAQALARATGAQVAVADVVRKELAQANGPSDVAWGEGIYTPAWTARTYERLLEIAGEGLATGQAVVVDASFLDGEMREKAAAVARQANVPFALVEVVCGEDVVLSRLEERQRAGTSPSDATGAIYHRQRERFRADPPPITAGAVHIQVDTTPESPVFIDPALMALEDAGVILPGIREDGALV